MPLTKIYIYATLMLEIVRHGTNYIYSPTTPREIELCEWLCRYPRRRRRLPGVGADQDCHFGSSYSARDGRLSKCACARWYTQDTPPSRHTMYHMTSCCSKQPVTAVKWSRNAGLMCGVKEQGKDGRTSASETILFPACDRKGRQRHFWSHECSGKV